MHLAKKQRLRYFALLILFALVTSLTALPDSAAGASRHDSAHQQSHRHHAKAAASRVRGKPTFCGYSSHSVAELGQLARLLGRSVDCAVVFSAGNPTWATWENPWYLHHADPNYNWANWKRARAGRQLILTQELFPQSVSSSRWLSDGSRGRYDSHDRALARNLVAAGLGHSYIRLGHEMNGTWYRWSVPNSRGGQRQWIALWQRTVSAMRSVPGAHFKFVWNVNYKVRALGLDRFYPGNKYVDNIGLDAYDAGVRVGRHKRFARLYSQDGGIRQVLNFARQHHKATSFPEWGLWQANNYGGGDDPTYIAGIAKLMRTTNVAFAGYWYAHTGNTQTLLRRSPKSLAQLRYNFGRRGYSLVRRRS